MTRRTERLGNLIRSIIAEAILGKLSDPRVEPARTSVTRVEVTEDLLTATVYVSVMDEPKRQKLALEALRKASGYFQELVGRQIHVRHTPVLKFELDERFKKTLETYQLIDEAMAEIHEKEADSDEASGHTDPGDNETRA